MLKVNRIKQLILNKLINQLKETNHLNLKNNKIKLLINFNKRIQRQEM